MATHKSDEVKSSNPEISVVKDEQTSEEPGQVAVSSSPPGIGSTQNAGSSSNTDAASSGGNETSKAAGGRGSPSAETPSDSTRRDSSAPSKASVNAHKSTTAKTARAKPRPSVGSVRKPNAADRHTSKISVSSKASGRAPGTSLHKAPSLSSVPTTVSACTSPIGSSEAMHPPRHFHAATQNQLTPELYPATPVPEEETHVASEHPDNLEKKEGKEESHVEGEEEVAEEPEKTEAKKKPEEIKSPVVKKPRKKPPRGFKMPDGTYVGLKEKNRYLRAMYKEHLKCDYVPFCILGVLMVVVIALVYLYAFRPVRKLLGLNKKDEDQDDMSAIRNIPPNSRVAAAPVLSTTPHYSGVASPPAYGVFAPYTMAAQNSYPGGQPALSTAYHYGPAPGAGMWQQQQQPGAPLVAPVQLTGLCQSGLPAPLPQPVFVRKETIADLARSNLSSPRRQSARRSDKPYMLQKCGPFFAWQLLIMWMAVLGTVVFVCSFGAFRHSVYLNASCGIRNPCRGVGLLCVGGHCVCGPDYEVQGELCGLKKNVLTEVTEVTVLPASTPGGQSRSVHPPDPRKGVHKPNDEVRVMVRLMKIPDDFDFSTSGLRDAGLGADVTTASTAAASPPTQLLWDVATTIVHYQLTEDECARLQKDENAEGEGSFFSSSPARDISPSVPVTASSPVGFSYDDFS
ncbi:hypothetical protein HPB49_012359 [Dermacentor silvarum]|uniref:Uncharacterized protein n=1 Tax=Dermacentor silvarum TaxID=543639 RepID=A0ACB8CX95_DERSI|nr:hypothetical protein HPB49_012359 [Dermacentor silvarum]